MDFVESPNLPRGQVRLCVMSGQYPELCRSVEALGVEVVRTGPCPGLPEPVAYHGDLQVCHLGGAELLLEPRAPGLMAGLTRRSFRCRGVSRPAGSVYPEDVRLGMLLLAPFCFGEMGAAAAEAVDFLRQRDWELVHSRQGYARCSVAVAGEGGCITADPTLYGLLRERGVDCLRIAPGDIRLPGYDTGFLGGCCGLLAPDRMAFTGSLARYREGERVADWLRKRGIAPVFLSDGPLIDIGGILPLMEER